MSKLTRREFLEAAPAGAAAAAGLGLAACKPPADATRIHKPGVPGTKGWHQGEERWVTSICGQCAAGCGIRARVVEGRAVKIEGNPAFPLNQGSLGPKGQAGLQVLYHPDRVPGPMRREGARGAGRLVPTTWDEAIGAVAAALKKLRDGGEARSLVVLDGEPRGTTHELWARFLEAFGSPNHIGHHSTGDGAKLAAMTYMQGVAELPAYDWSSTRFVIAFGASLFESSCQTMHLTRAASVLRKGVQGYRAKFVQVAPRLSGTAAKADEWVQIEPGTYGALALGLAHVLVRDGLFDQAFVRDHTLGFEPWKDAGGTEHQGFRQLLLEAWTPEAAAKVTGVPAETIERLAREMAQLRPALAVADGNAATSTNGVGTAMAIHALNALLGNLERPGGLMVQRQAPLSPWKPVGLDAAAQAGRASPRLDGAGGPSAPLALSLIQALPEAILSGKPYAAGALFLHYSNPVFSKPDGKRWREALEKVPLVVSFSPLLDESTQWADFVLPDHTYLERWDITQPVPAVGHPVIGLRQPVVAPQKDTRQTSDVILRLATAIGGSVAASFAWDDTRAAVSERLAGLTGKTSAGADKPAADAAEVLSGLEEKGGWWQPEQLYERWDFPTPSKRFEFYSQALQKRLAEVFPEPAALERWLSERGVATRGDALYMPHWEPARWAGEAAEYPLLLTVYRSVAYAEGGVRHLPWLVELNRMVKNPYREYVELAPEHAKSLGVRDEDEVWVESPAGKRRLRVRIDAGTRPGTVSLMLGNGVWPPPPAASEPTGGLGLLSNHSDPLAGIFAQQGTRVRVTRATT